MFVSGCIWSRASQGVDIIFGAVAGHAPERGSRDERFERAQGEAFAAQNGGEFCRMGVRVCEYGANGLQAGEEHLCRIGNRDGGCGAARGRPGRRSAGFAG